MRSFAGLDTETPEITEEDPFPEIVCAQIYWPGSPPFVLLRRDAEPVLRGLFRTCLDQRVTILAHNASFDFATIWRTFPRLGDLIWELFRAGLVECTLLREKLDDIARGRYLNKIRQRYIPGFGQLGYGLDDAVWWRCGVRMDKDPEIRNTFASVDGVPVELWEPRRRAYAAQDPLRTVELAWRQEEAEERAPVRPGCYVYRDAVPQTYALWALALCRWIGVWTDGPTAVKIRAQKEVQKDEHLVELTSDYCEVCHKTFLRKPEPDKCLWCGRLLVRGFLRPGYTTPRSKEYKAPSMDTKLVLATIEQTARSNGFEPKRVKPKDWNDKTPEHERGISRDEEAIALVAPYEPRLLKLQKYQKAQKSIGYLNKLEKGFLHPLHSEPNALIANGRCSWGQDDEIEEDFNTGNLQNIPGELGLRECYVSPRGYYLFSIDYGQIELCTFAQICLWRYGYSRMAQIINQGISVHDVTAGSYLGISHEEVFARKEAKDQFIIDIRDAAKIGNFGFLGGMGVDRFMTQNLEAVTKAKMTRADVQRLKWSMETTYPEFKLWMNDARIVSEGNKQVLHPISGRIAGGLGYCDAANYPFSGLNADIVKAALCEISYACWADRSSPAYGSHVIAPIHDEFFGAVPIARAHEAATEIQSIAIRVAKRYVPDVVIKSSIALMTRWRKSAAEYRVDGWLRPYEESPLFAKRLAEGKEWAG